VESDGLQAVSSSTASISSAILRGVRRTVLAPILVLASACGAAEAPAPRHLIYLHGRIIQEQQSARPRHPEFGDYELDAILAAFRDRGFVVSGGIRPKAASVSESADRVVEQVRGLLAAGVPPDHVTVVGASMGASIAFLAATRLQEPELRVSVLGGCLSENVRALEAEEGRGPSGRLLSIREASDELSEPCPKWEEDATPGSALRAREIVLETGLRHGFLYRPLAEWVDPVSEWAGASATRP
jgi:pimeloyl-ACP methyl ester carboxylesterase